MAFNVVFGASGTGKSEYILNEAKELSQNGRKVIIIVPEQFSHLKETELIGKVGYITDDFKATSFKRLSYEALKRVGEGRKNPDKIKKNILLAKAVHSLNNELTYFANVQKKPGFISVIQELISDFKRSCVMPNDVYNILETIDDKNVFKLKLKEIAIIYERYQDLLSGRFIDDDDNISYLADIIEKKADLKGTTVFIDEFFRFTLSEQKTIGAFLKAGADVCVALCTPTLEKEKSGIFEPVVSTYNSLLKVAKDSGVEISKPIFLNKQYRFESKELSHLETEFSKNKYDIYNEETDDLSLFVASDTYSEVMHVACAIKKAVMGGVRYRDIAIICGETEKYKNIVKTVFDIYEIPVFLDSKRELTSHPVIIMISSLFEILIKGYDTKFVLSYLKSGYSTLNREETDILENFVLSGNIRKADWLDDEKFLKRARSVFEDSEDLNETNKELAQKVLELKQRLISPIYSLREKMMQKKRVNDRVDTLISFFDEINLCDKIKQRINILKDAKDFDLANEYAEVYNVLMQTLESIVVCLDGESIGLERLADTLNAAFSECSIGVIPPIYDGVFFGDLSRSIARNVKELFIIGANDGTFPPKAPIEGVLNDEERIYLKSRGMSLAPDTKKILFDYDFMVYNTINISKSKLSVSYPVLDLGGNGLRPSAFVSKLTKIFPNIKYSSDVSGKDRSAEEFVLSKKSAYNYLTGKENLSDAEKQIYDLLAEDEKYRNMLIVADRISGYKKDAERLDSDVVKSLYGGNLRGSVSSFEKYSGCPFSYFITYGLSAKERKLFDIDTPDFGSLLHRVIDIFSKRITETETGFSKITKTECENIISEILDEVVDNMFIKKLYSEKKMMLLVKRLKKYAFRAAWAVCEHIKKGMFEPCAFEAEFSENGDMAPVEIELPTGDKITLIGKIDRIDKLEKNGELYIKVIDYKTGKKDFSLSDIYNKLSLQLCVYITAVCDSGECLFDKEAQPAGMFYFKLIESTVKAAKNEEFVDEQHLAAYKMSGIVLDDMEIIKAMDGGIVGASKILPVSLNTGGEIIKSRSKTATSLQMDSLKSYIKKVAGEIGREILEGRVDILPYREGKNTACDYCRFHSICAFDEDVDCYRQIGTIKDDAVWEMLTD